MKMYSLITGLIRDQGKLEEKVKKLSEWRAEGLVNEIIFSTWIGEIDSYPDARKFLESNRVQIVESEEPTEKLQGHLLHQMKAIDAGLRACPEHSMVLKLRTDKMDLTDGIKRGISFHDLEPKPYEGWPHIFSKRILVLGGLLAQPLFFNDIVYLGQREDLLKLVRHGINEEVKGFRMNPEQVFYLNPFIDSFPIFKSFFGINPGLNHDDAEKAARIQSLLLREKNTLEALVTYYMVLEQYFRCGFDIRSDGRNLFFGKQLKELTYSELFSFDTKKKRPLFDYSSGANAIFFAGDYWVQMVLNGELFMDEIGEQIVACAKNLRSYTVQKSLTWNKEIEAALKTKIEAA